MRQNKTNCVPIKSILGVLAGGVGHSSEHFPERFSVVQIFLGKYLFHFITRKPGDFVDFCQLNISVLFLLNNKKSVTIEPLLGFPSYHGTV